MGQRLLRFRRRLQRHHLQGHHHRLRRHRARDHRRNLQLPRSLVQLLPGVAQQDLQRQDGLREPRLSDLLRPRRRNAPGERPDELHLRRGGVARPAHAHGLRLCRLDGQQRLDEAEIRHHLFRLLWPPQLRRALDANHLHYHLRLCGRRAVGWRVESGDLRHHKRRVHARQSRPHRLRLRGLDGNRPGRTDQRSDGRDRLPGRPRLPRPLDDQRLRRPLPRLRRHRRDPRPGLPLRRAPGPRSRRRPHRLRLLALDRERGRLGRFLP